MMASFSTTFHTAIRTGQLEHTKTYLDQNKLSNYPDLLHLAATYGRVEIAKMLITLYNYPVDRKNKQRQTPLHVACIKGHLSMVKMLVSEHQANLTLCDKNSDTPLHKAAWCGQTAIVNYLISKFNLDPRTKGSKGRTILHLACRQGHAELVEKLLTHYNLEAELMCTDNDGNIPLHHAAWNGSETLLISLIFKYKCPVEYTNHSGQTSLHLACCHGDAKEIETLLTQCDPDLLSTCDKHGNTPLHLAALNGNERVAKLLITKYYKNCPLGLENGDKETPLHIACNNGHLGLIRLMVNEFKADLIHSVLCKAAWRGQIEIVNCLISEFNCNPRYKGAKGRTILHLACRHGHAELVETLLTRYRLETELLSADNDGNIPLHHAALSDNEAILKSLITKYKCPAEYRNHGGQTPLHLACCHGNVKQLETLLTQYGPDILSTCDDNGNAPLHFAALGGHDKVVELLITTYNCPLNIENNNKETPLHIACNKGHLKVIRLMVIEFKADLIHSTHIAAWQGKTVAMKSMITMLNKNSGNLYYKPSDHEYIGETYDCVPSSLQYFTSNCSDSVHSLLQPPIKYEAIEKKVAAALLITKYDSRKTSIIRIFIVEYNVEFDLYNIIRTKDALVQLYEGIWYGSTQTIMLAHDKFATSAAVEVMDDIIMLNLASRHGYIELINILLTQYSIDPLSADNNGNTPLHYAAWGGREDAVKLLITEYNCVVNVQNNNNQTPLHMACSTGQVSIIGMLVTEHKADLCNQEKNVDTPLHIAAWYGHTDLVKCLINKFSCNPNSRGLTGETILHHACRQGHMELVKTLLTEYNLDPSCTDNNGGTSLHFAVLGGSEDIIKLLITKYHCLVDSKNKIHETPLHFACAGGYFEIVRMLAFHYGANLHSCDCNGDTPLHKAAIYGQMRIIKYLINNCGYDPNIKGYEGRTILHHACHQGHVELVNSLLKIDKLDPLSMDDNGFTSLHYAAIGHRKIIAKLLITKYNQSIKRTNGCSLMHLVCQQGDFELVERLVTDYKFDSMICDDSGNTPLHYAAMGGKNEVATLLITKYGYHADHLNNNNETPLHLACTKGHITFIQTLVTEHKVDINICDTNNHTPLERAALSGQAKVIDYFITELNCNADVKGTDSCNLLHFACQEGHLELVEHLVIDYKLDPMIGDDNGNTPLHYAALAGKTEVATLLITRYGSPVNHPNNNNETSLHLACVSGHLKLVRMLIFDYNANLDSCDNNNNTPLHKAATYGQADVINCLTKEFRCNPNAKGYQGRTILHHACHHGHIELVEALLTHYKLSLLSVDNNGYTPLHLTAIGSEKTVAKVLITKYGHSVKGTDGCSLFHLVCKQGDFELVEKLVMDYKFDPMIGDDNGNTPLHYAAMGGKNEVATLLITKYGYHANYRNYNNETPLHLACTKGYTTFIRALVTEHKVDINICDTNNHTPLQRAALSGQVKVIDYFITEFTNCNADIKGTNGCNLLHLACQGGHLELVEHLVIDYKLDPKIGDNNGNTPLHYAALGGRTEVAALLITRYGSRVNHPNNNNETPLHLACASGHIIFIQALLVEHKADVNTYDINHDTPLQRAALSGQASVVCSLILEFSCDPNVTGVQGRNLLHYACFNDYDELAWTLVKTFNFSLVSADTDGNSPLHISAMFGQMRCVRMLLYVCRAPVYLRNNSGKSALEVARDTGTRNIINTYLKEEHNRIQYDYKEVQNLSRKKYSGAQRLTRVFVLGNVQSGKSTLIESLKRQGFFSSFNQVSEATVPPHTSGIIPSEYCHKSMGRVLYYDFAGDPEYYSSHSAIISSVMQSKEGTNVCLILINFQKNDKSILEELGYWFNFISYHCTRLTERCKVLTIGSHVDLITKNEANRKVALVSEFTDKYSKLKVSIEFVKGKSDLIINCCKPRSSTCVHSALNQILRRAASFGLSEEAAILLGVLQKDFKNVVTCKLQTLLTHIIETGVHLPTVAHSLYPKVMELHTIGLLMVIESKSDKLENYLLLLNVPRLTNEVHKFLFSKDSIISSTDSCGASMGILPQTYLNSILPEYITTDCLIQLQYCQEFCHAEVKFDYSVIPTDDSMAPKLLYFPALCKTDRRASIETPEGNNYSISWYLKCREIFDYLPPRFLHVLLLRLAHSFALPDHASNVTAAVRPYNRRCTMWKNGIHWLMTEGVECFIELINSSKGIVIITKSEEAWKLVCTNILFEIIKEIHQAKEEFCETVALQEYMINSDDPDSFTNENRLFHASDIAEVLNEGKQYIVSADREGRNRLSAATVYHLKEYIRWDAKENQWTLAPKQREDAVSVVTEIEDREVTKLSEDNHSVLYAKLTEHSTKWRDIGTHLKFRPSELANIHARPLLLSDAPNSWLNTMLAEWLQWSPGDQRGSTKCATLEGLSDALKKTGLPEAAQSIKTLDLTA